MGILIFVCRQIANTWGSLQPSLRVSEADGSLDFVAAAWRKLGSHLHRKACACTLERP